MTPEYNPQIGENLCPSFESGDLENDPAGNFARLEGTVRFRGVRERVAPVNNDAEIPLIEKRCGSLENLRLPKSRGVVSADLWPVHILKGNTDVVELRHQIVATGPRRYDAVHQRPIRRDEIETRLQVRSTYSVEHHIGAVPTRPLAHCCGHIFGAIADGAFSPELARQRRFVMCANRCRHAS